MAPGSIVTGVVVAIESDFVIVNAGLKSEGVIPRHQFLDDNGELAIAEGDEVQVALESLEDGFGSTQLSREKAKRVEAWRLLETAYENGETVQGVITGKVRGGFTVSVGLISAFLPGSLLDMHPMRDTSHLEGTDLDFKLVKLDAKRNNIVVSRRAVLEELNSADREKLLETLDEGIVLKGIVKNITDYGAFIDLGGIDGLLHITDIAWKRVKHPSEAFGLGDEVEVKVLKFDREKTRVSLGMKQLTEDPWQQLVSELAVGERKPAKVTNLTEYGCFAQISPGVEGLVHVSEMDWTNKNVHPSKVVSVGQEIEVMILDIDTNRRRISLGMKQCQMNPWQAFAAEYQKGDKISGKIRSITDFGIFVGLPGHIDGLVHLSDLSWDEPGEEAVKQYRKGQDVDAVVVSVDVERERIALSIKQVDGDSFGDYLGEHRKGSVVTGTVAAVERGQLLIDLADGVQANMRASDASQDRLDDLSDHFKVGQSVEAVISAIDSRSRQIGLSIKQLEQQQQREAMASVQQQQTQEDDAPTTIGDLIKAQMDKRDS